VLEVLEKQFPLQALPYIILAVAAVQPLIIRELKLPVLVAMAEAVLVV
jgi:hypothetical protein